MLDECAALLPTEPISSPPDGHDYRRLARQIRDLARQTRLQYRGPSCFGSPLITTGAAITSTGEPSRSAPSWCGGSAAALYRQARPTSTTLSRTSILSLRSRRAISSIETPRTSISPNAFISASDHSLPVFTGRDS